MDITEKDLEDLMFDDLSANHGRKLEQRGFKTQLRQIPEGKKWLRQVQLKDYGVADIIGFARHKGRMIVDVIELKNKPLALPDYEQVFRYKKAVDEILFNTFKGHFYHDVKCFLVGPGIDSGHYLHNELYNLDVHTFKFSVDGFIFERHGTGWYRGDGKLTYFDVVPRRKHNIKLTELLRNPVTNG